MSRISKLSESRRLGYLARLFFEQIEYDEKIFVRCGGFEADGEIWALHRLLRSFNPQVRLLIVRPTPERAGRVEQLAPNLYRGFLPKFSDPRPCAGDACLRGLAESLRDALSRSAEKGRIDPTA